MNQMKYELIPVVDDEPWAEYEIILHQTCLLNRLPPITIVKNKMNQYVSNYDALKYILVAGNTYEVSLKQILALHDLSLRKYPVDLLDMKVRWISRVDQIEYEILPWLPPTTPNFDELVVATYVGLGLAENAILYLSSIPAAMLFTCLCNKRIDELNSWVVFNPSHVVFDHPARDIADLVKLNMISDTELFAYIQNKHMNEAEISYLVARLLYPFQLFDSLESLYTEEKTELGMDLQVFESSVHRMLHLVKQLLIRFSLRPIEWILL